MENQLFSLSKIFTERILRIPDYQRGYSWGEKQLKDFWNDLLQLDESKNHYTGVLTLETVPSNILTSWSDDLWIIQRKSYKPFYVVDGQQRLTTSLILIQSILEFMSHISDLKLNFSTINEIKKKYIYDSKDDGISRSYIFGYEKDNPSYEFLKRQIFHEKSDDFLPLQATIYTSNLSFAKKFFIAEIQNMSHEQLELIYRKLTQHFLFNIYSISEEIDVHVSFETMNNRGKSLSVLELLKNRLIWMSTKYEVDEYEKSKLRKIINECWKSIYYYLGKNSNNPLDDDEFLHNHFMIYYGNQDNTIAAMHSNHRLGTYWYKDYLLDTHFTSKNIIDKEINISDIYKYSQNLKDSVEIWYQIHNPMDSELSNEEKVWLDKLNKIGIKLVAPLIMVFCQKESNSKQRVRLFKVLERSLFISSFTLQPFVLTNELSYNSLAQQLWQNLKNVEQIIKDIEHDTEKLVQELIPKMKSERKGDFYRWRKIRYFMYEYELHLKSKSKSKRDKLNWSEFNRYLFSSISIHEMAILFDIDDVFSILDTDEDSQDYYTVEHIYPQKTGRKLCWTKLFSHYDEKEKNILKNSLGNLLPLSSPKNSSLQNQCFEEKKGSPNKPGYIHGSYSEIEVASYTKWTAIEIFSRGLQLLEFMEKRWKLNLGDRLEKIRILNLEFVIRKENLDE